MRPFNVAALLQLAAAVHFSPQEYTTIKHVEHPAHKIVYKHNGVAVSAVQTLKDNRTADIEAVCPGATPGHTGYLISGTKHFFFAFFQSRSKPETDPLVLWTNGGPGCSGLIGLLTEHGPCQLQADGAIVRNDQSWVNTANMIYVEQPVGAGYSFDTSNFTSSTTWMAAKDIVIFLNLWYSHFPQYKKNDFHLSGESYAGHYLPMFAKEIRDYNGAMHKEDQIPLESIIIGNGQYDLTIQEMSVYNMTCTAANGLGGPVLNATECAEMESIIPECHRLYRECSKTLANKECEPAFQTCFPQTELKFLDSNRDIYDIRVHCLPGTACDPYSKLNTDYWNDPKVQAAFGASDPEWKVWEECNDDIYMAFLNANDGWDASAPVLKDLLDQDLRVLLYHGVYDVICNYVGAEEVLSNLDWSGLDAYNKASASPITWSGGKYWEARNLRYSRVNNAGHFVPRSQPFAASELFRAWLEKRPMH